MKNLAMKFGFDGTLKISVTVGTFIALGFWLFWRVARINPAILGDEYLYSVNSRHALPWEDSPAGDFSNYLFNFVYSSSNLCGAEFYSCVKTLNIIFFLGFIFLILVLALKFLGFWSALLFSVVAGLSPISIYVSLFLPESMYFFMIGLVLMAALKAGESYNWQNWAKVGLYTGLASLVKPHAWLSALAIGIFLMVVGLSRRENRARKLLQAIASFSASAIITRLAIGVLVGGPKAVDFFGVYLGAETLQELSTGLQAAEPGVEEPVGTSPLAGVQTLFWPQLQIHTQLVAALMGVAVLGMVARLISLAMTRKAGPADLLSLLSLIWLLTLVIEIVIFTGWITGQGDDHSSRVLSRYYDFLFVIVPLAGLVSLSSGAAEKVNVWVRGALAGGLLYLISKAFTSTFAFLEIQIADTPTLAGLVVSADIFNAAALIAAIGLLIFAFQPRFAAWALVCALPFTMVGTGFSIQNEYDRIRGFDNAQDSAGQYLRSNLSESELSRTWVAATSRFEATNVGFWADSPDLLDYGLFIPGGVLEESSLPNDVDFVVITGDLTYGGPYSEVHLGEGFSVYRLP